MSHQVLSDRVRSQQIVAQQVSARGSVRGVRLDRFEEGYIKWKARQLAGKAGFSMNDVEDIEQDFRLCVLEKLPKYDSAKSSRHTFVALVVRRCFATMLERQLAAKRNVGRQLESLNDTVLDSDGCEVELHETISHDPRRPSVHDRRSEDEQRDLIADVRHVVAFLPRHLRQWCGVFSEMSFREASRKYHVPRSRLQQIRAEIRVAFEEAGLDAYLPQRRPN